ncbi:LPS biosynthesis protein, partial [Francisella tularensis subsp. holarctica]|nr:LPS biosynthesis protein [Francisella tularensis subsp. holarctica]
EITNLNIAFPEKSDQEIKKLVDDSYKSAIMAGFESLISWFMTKKNFNKIPFYNDLRSFDEIHYDKDKTLLLLGFHFHCLEIAVRYICEKYSPFTVMYQ